MHQMRCKTNGWMGLDIREYAVRILRSSFDQGEKISSQVCGTLSGDYWRAHSMFILSKDRVGFSLLLQALVTAKAYSATKEREDESQPASQALSSAAAGTVCQMLSLLYLLLLSAGCLPRGVLSLLHTCLATRLLFKPH